MSRVREPLDESQHRAFGKTLHGVTTFLLHMGAQVQQAYGKNAKAMRQLRRTLMAVNSLRSALDDAACWERPGDPEAERLYYPLPEGPKVVQVKLAEVERCLFCGLGESSFRRGVCHAFNLAGDIVREGATADDLDILTDLAADWRCHARPDVHVPDDLVMLWRRGERGVTGLDLRTLGVTK